MTIAEFKAMAARYRKKAAAANRKSNSAEVERYNYLAQVAENHANDPALRKQLTNIINQQKRKK